VQAHGGGVVYRRVMAVVDLVNLVVTVVTLALKVWALGDAAVRPSAAFDAVGKLPKLFWVIVLGLAVLTQVAVGLAIGWPASWLNILGLAGIVAALVYLFGIRPEVMRYGPRRKGGRSSDGPYGPW
jgi:hypothetical protein